MKKLISITGLIVALIVVTYFLVTSFIIIANPYATNDMLLKEEICKLNETEEFVFNEIIPFEWETVYSFEPGTSKEYIEKTIGISNSKIKDVPKDKDTVCYIFVDKGFITSYPCGNVKDIGYKLNLETDKGQHAELHYHEWAVFYAESKNGYVNLTDMVLVRQPDFLVT